MSLPSLRLGCRVRWDRDARIRRWLNPFGHRVFPAASELFLEIAGRRSTGNTFVELSDGGHFDNIGRLTS